MRLVKPVVLLCAAALAACTAVDTRKSIEGNNTGGVIPVNLARGADVQGLANAHCARWNTAARITFNEVASGGDVVFICETEAGPALFGTPAGSALQAPTAPSAGAPKAPAKR